MHSQFTTGCLVLAPTKLILHASWNIEQLLLNILCLHKFSALFVIVITTLLVVGVVVSVDVVVVPL